MVNRGVILKLIDFINLHKPSVFWLQYSAKTLIGWPFFVDIFDKGHVKNSIIRSIWDQFHD